MNRNPNDYLIQIPIRGPVRIPLQPSWWQRFKEFSDIAQQYRCGGHTWSYAIRRAWHIAIQGAAF